ncbi:MAG: hypothetical protein COZ72_06850 [Elusimicrobia bacterium CG_4_8_14_3_um_filter_50_9]|nr:MAG: hypothetical protein COZ72_06850 [Elusimicrobia bacterium CG_4_8_14_3_um_filter_50_9]
MKNDKDLSTVRLGRMLMAVFFLSGATGLIYQVIWARMLGLVFGNTTYAVSTILAGFMAGLAIGSWYFGRFVDRAESSPLKIFSWLMLGIGIYGALTPVLFGIIRKIYVLFGIAQITTGSILLVFLLGFITILIPTALMGGTLPVLAKWLEQQSEAGGGQSSIGNTVGILYSVNTWGAVLGAFLTGYVFIMIFGVRGTLYLAATVNIAIAGIVVVLSRQIPLYPPLLKGDTGEVKPADIKNSPLSTFHFPLVLIAVAVSGFTALAYEVVWTRVLSMVLGSSVYAFATMLCAFLTGIALGSMIYAKISKNHPVSYCPDKSGATEQTSPFDKGGQRGISVFGFIQAGIGISVLLLIPVFGVLPAVFLKFFTLAGAGLEGFQFVQFFMVFGVMLIPTTLFGATIPLACKIYSVNIEPCLSAGRQQTADNKSVAQSSIANRQSSIGSSIGNVYAANTAGAILGSIIAGFVLIPLIGLQKTMTAVAVINAGLAILILNFESLIMVFKKDIVKSYANLNPSRVALTYFLIFFIIPYAVAMPAWNKKMIASGIYEYVVNYAADIDRGMTEREIWDNREKNEKLLFYQEGKHFTVSVENIPSSDITTLRIDGKVDASNSIKADMITQLFSAHLPVMFHNDPGEVLVVGLASGVTLGGVCRWKNIQKIDCVEIEPAMIEASHYFDEWNGRPLEDKRVKVFTSDARNYLLSAKKKYDVIISVPSNPWMSGSAALFTQDYFKQALSKLNPDGIFCFFSQLYCVSPEEYKIILNTAKTVFPYIYVWEASPFDTIVMASREDLSIDSEKFQEKFNSVKADFQRIGIKNQEMLLTRFIMGGKDAENFIGSISDVNTDDHPLIEFSGGRNIYNRGLYEVNYNMLAKVRKSASSVVNNFSEHKVLASAYIGRKMYNQAQYELKVALDKAPSDKEALNLMGYTYMALNMLPSAEEMFNKSSAADPNYARPLINLGRVYVLQNKLDAAEHILKKALKIDPLNSAVHNNIGDVYNRKGEYLKANKHFAKAISSDPDFLMAYINLGVNYIDRIKSPEKAREILLKALDMDNNSAMINYQLGRAYLALNKPEESKDYFNSAMRIDPKYVDIVLATAAQAGRR